MATASIKVCLLGCGGNMRGAHVPRIQADGNVHVVGVADPNQKQIDSLLSKLDYEPAQYDDWHQLIDHVDADAVIVSTPHDQHYEQISACLNSGYHVLAEKPLVVNPQQARSCLDMAQTNKRILLVAYQRHWMREYVYARELIRSGSLGDIRGIVGYVTQNWVGMSGWRLDPIQSGGGMFIDTGSHLVAAMLFVTGLQPHAVHAVLNRGGYDVDVNLSCHVEFKSGAIGSLTTIGNAARHDERLMISGSKGSLVLHLHAWRVQSMLLNDEPVEIPDHIRANSPDQAFFAGIREGIDTVEVPEFAVEVSKLTDAAYRSVNDESVALVID